MKFTAQMENKLDKIAAGKKKWQPIIKKFYEPFEKRLEKKYEEVDKVVEKTDKKCPECGSPLLIRFSKYGKFLACSAFPECKYSEPLDKDKRPEPKKIGLKCPKCKRGDIVERYTRKNNKKFWGCSRFPKCKFATWDDPKEDSKSS